jgi:hypothetical protein
MKNKCLMVLWLSTSVLFGQYLIATDVSASQASILDDLIAQARAGRATSLLFLSQDQRDVAFKKMAQLYPVRHIPRSEAVHRLDEAPEDFSDLTYAVEGTGFGLNDFLKMRASRGLIATKNGQVRFEYYADGHSRNTQWVSFSVTKSVTSMLVGAAIKDGYIRSVDEPVAHYLPRLRGTGYENITIKNVLQMASGIAWNEDYADPDSDVANAGGANGLALVSYLGSLMNVAEPGAVFNYNTGETNLVGEILRAAIGNNASTYLTHKIWQPYGMESDANWLLGGVGGGETGGCCISATLRDYARIGLFAMNGGLLADGTRVLPRDWMTASTSPSKGAAYYGYLWWLNQNEYAARGIFGQQIFVDPKSRVVIAAHSNAVTAVNSDYHKHLEGVIRALSTRLKNN